MEHWGTPLAGLEKTKDTQWIRQLLRPASNFFRALASERAPQRCILHHIARWVRGPHDLSGDQRERAVTLLSSSSLVYNSSREFGASQLTIHVTPNLSVNTPNVERPHSDVR